MKRKHRSAIVRQDLAELARIESRLAEIEALDLTKFDRLEDVKAIADQAATFVRLANRKRLGLRVSNRGATIEVVATHRLGELYARVERIKYRAGGGDGIRSTLDRLKISPGDAHRAQELAATISVEQIRARSLAATEAGERFSLHTVLVEMARERKVEMHATVQHKTPPGLAGQRFRVLYADPPWDYNDDRIFPTGGYGKAATHYPTMSIAAIAALEVDGRPVRELAVDDAVLFLWVTAPKLNECWPVIDAWGFTYKTGMVWDKVEHNFGHYVSVRHEHVLIATRGSCKPDRPTPMPDSVQVIRRSEIHSAKPREIADLICQLYDGPRLELFAREATDDRFLAWGNEVVLA